MPARHVPGVRMWVIVGHGFSAAELILWVIVGHGFLMTHNDPRGKGTNFVHAVCGSCGSLFRPLSIAPNTEPYTNLTTHKQNLSYKKTLPTITHKQKKAFIYMASSVSHWRAFSIPPSNTQPPTH